MNQPSDFGSRYVSRRQMLKRTSAGFGSLALSGLLAGLARAESKASGQRSGRDNPLAPRPGHHAARAKRVIFLFIHGGPSQVDTFDYKPRLVKDDGKPLPFDKPRVQFAQTSDLMSSPWKFRQYGQSGLWVSDLFPEIGKHCADDLCVIRSLHGSNAAHGGALLMMHTGSDTFVRPSIGSWTLYGLGTENQDLPGFITICPTLGHGGVNNFSSAFLPAVYHGTRLGHSGMSSTRARVEYLDNEKISTGAQRAKLDMLNRVNARHREMTGPDAALEARIESFELAFRMQMEAPGVMDVDSEPDYIRSLYGLDEETTRDFAHQCILARRFAEAGVRFVQCTHGYWDQHSDLRGGHGRLAKQIDQPIAGLLRDLKARGLLEDTLVIWGGEFGRTPTRQGSDGRDHNPHGFCWWMAGAGLKSGMAYGETDEYGYYAVRDNVHVHDLHATILHLLGIDHEQLTYRYAGRDFRLTDVEGHVVHDIVA